MAQEFYIDENGNMIPISGTVTSADMLPMSASDDSKVSEAIGDRSTLTTTDKSSIVGAVNEVNGKIGVKTITVSGSIGSLAGGSSKSLTANDLNYVIPTGYTAVGLGGWIYYGSNTRNLCLYDLNLNNQGSNNVINIQNNGSSATGSGATVTITIFLVKTATIT